MNQSTNKLAALLAAKRIAQTSSVSTPVSTPAPKLNLAAILKAKQVHEKSQVENVKENPFAISVDKYGNSITYNKAQQEFIRIASSGTSCILIGAAGTGKTTCMRGVATSLIQSGKLSILNNSDHKHLVSGTPGIVFCAYTRRATANLRRNLPEDLKANCITIHKLLEYEPVFYTVTDPETGDEKSIMKFEPTRNSYNPLSPDIRVVVFEESSMIGIELYKEVIEALPHNVQYIFLGDIQQLPPVFGAAILGYKMLELPTVELTEVYRQALESPIIRLAHRILSGTTIMPQELEDWRVAGLTLHPWKKKLHPDIACLTFAKFIIQAYDKAAYNPEEDIILLPFNKSFGTDEVNKHIANYIARKKGLLTYEVIAGFNKHYLSVGDKVLVDKEDAIITHIEPNPNYTGTSFQPPSVFLDYWGHNQNPQETAQEEMDEDAVDFLLSQVSSVEDEDRVRQASHIIYLRRYDSDDEFKLDSAAGLNSMSLGYAITIHKSQGSEWRKVFLILHQSHATMLQRELLYTAVTRAKEELYVICEPETFVKGILSQRIKGNTLREKAEYFKGKLETNGGEY